MKTNNEIEKPPIAEAMTWQKQSWNSFQPIFVKIDISGNPIGWMKGIPTGANAKGAFAENNKATAQCRGAGVGDVVSVPMGFHGVHGVTFRRWLKVS